MHFKYEGGCGWGIRRTFLAFHGILETHRCATSLVRETEMLLLLTVQDVREFTLYVAWMYLWRKSLGLFPVSVVVFWKCLQEIITILPDG
jgi:hypothetical protein